MDGGTAGRAGPPQDFGRGSYDLLGESLAMTVDRIRRRLDRLAELTAAARVESISSTLDRVHAAMARGEYKAPALDPPPPDGASRRERCSPTSPLRLSSSSRQ